METRKNLCAMLPVALHTRVRQEQEKAGMTLGEYVLSLIHIFIRAVGLILLGFGILQVGLSLKSHDPSQRANGILTVAGGIVITFTKEILTLITG